MPEKFYSNLRQLRENSGLSIRSAAKELNLSPATISNWERLNRSPPADRLEDIAVVYKCRLEDFFKKK